MRFVHLAAGLGAAILAVTLTLSSAVAAPISPDSYGDCHLVGEPGKFKLETVKPGVLTIKADLPSRGWWNGDVISEIKDGYEYCLAAEIAYLSGIPKMTLENVSFDKLVSGTLTGYDMSLDEIGITPQRAKVVSFSAPYYSSYIGVMAKPGSDITADNIRGKTLGLKKGTVAASWVLENLKPERTPRVYPGDTEALVGLVAGQVDAYLQDVAIELGQVQDSRGKAKILGRYQTDQAYGIMLPKDSPNVATVNAIIAWCREQGFLDQLASTYLTPAFGGEASDIPVWTLP